MRINRKKLIGLMLDRDMNMNDLVSKSGVSRCTVSSVKNGKSCTSETAEKIADALGGQVHEIEASKKG